MAKRETKAGRRARLLGKYAGDRNIEIESNGREWLAYVMCRLNPATGIACSENGEIIPVSDPHRRYGLHEYRFKTGSGGWIAGPDLDRAEATAEQSYEECDGVMRCRDCGDAYEPSAGPRRKATLDGFVTGDTLMKLAAERGNWINLSDSMRSGLPLDHA